jgi:hypothetical protein
MKKITILFLMMTLFSCTTSMKNVAPNPTENNNKFVEQILRNIITQGMDF